MPKMKSKDAKIDFSGNSRFRGQFPSLFNYTLCSNPKKKLRERMKIQNEKLTKKHESILSTKVSSFYRILKKVLSHDWRYLHIAGTINLDTPSVSFR